ncbi:MAG: Tachylectin protein [Deltaproteobacteria bacterium]|nr:Tachylectin protein [Deltaproteobacteria bacterium]
MKFIGLGVRQLVALLVSAAMTFGSLPIAFAQTLPGEPAPQPASAQYLSSEEAVQAAVGWAKFGKQPDTNVVGDTAVGVLSVAFPPAGIALGIFWDYMKSLSSVSTPLGEALRALSNRIDDLDKRILSLQAQVEQIRNGLLKLTNERRLAELLNRRDAVKKLTFLLRQSPTDQKIKEQIAYDVQILAARYLPDAGPDQALWYWSDQKVVRNPSGQLAFGDMVDADFKVLPTFEYYASTLILLMLAIEYETAGNPQLAVRKYGKDLLRHAAFLSIRTPWREFGDQPATLPEQVMVRNTCYIQPSGPYPQNRTCGSYYICDDIMRRTRTFYPGPNYSVASNDQMCTLPDRPRRVVSQTQRDQLWAEQKKIPRYGTSAMQTWEQWSERSRPFHVEEEMERAYGVEGMANLANTLERFAKFGSTREQLIGKFDYTYYTKQFLYALKANGELVWFAHTIGVDKNPPKPPVVATTGLQDSTQVTAATGTVTAQGGVANKLGAVGSVTDQSSSVARQGASTPQSKALQKSSPAAVARINQPPAPRVFHQWEGPKQVGNGWQGFSQIIPAGLSGVYGLAADGSLKWYRHDGFSDGTVKWKGPVDVGKGTSIAPRPAGGTPAVKQRVTMTGGWRTYKKIVAGGDGVLYGIGADGSLHWHRHQDYADASAQPKWATPSVVGAGWGNFVDVFSTGEGVIYAVATDGRLLWYRHKGYLTGQNIWDGPKVVGSGWASFKKVFSPGTGMIYALQPDGALLWYQHDGYQDGTARWQGPTKIAADWGNFVQVFPHLWGTPQASIVR